MGWQWGDVQFRRLGGRTNVAPDYGSWGMVLPYQTIWGVVKNFVAVRWSLRGCRSKIGYKWRMNILRWTACKGFGWLADDCCIVLGDSGSMVLGHGTWNWLCAVCGGRQAKFNVFYRLWLAWWLLKCLTNGWGRGKNYTAEDGVSNLFLLFVLHDATSVNRWGCIDVICNLKDIVPWQRTNTRTNWLRNLGKSIKMGRWSRTIVASAKQ